jgi:hypothetical protein
MWYMRTGTKSDGLANVMHFLTSKIHPRVEAGKNASTVIPAIVRGDGKTTQ